MPEPDRKPLARSLGEFFGILWQAAMTDVTKPPHAPAPRGREPQERPTVVSPPVLVRRDVQERTVETATGEVVLRRTTIDEVVAADRTGDDPGAVGPPIRPEG